MWAPAADSYDENFVRQYRAGQRVEVRFVLHRTTLRYQHQGLTKTAEHQESSLLFPRPDHLPRLAAGTPVLLHGLRSDDGGAHNNQWNGAIGKVKRFDDKTQRYAVEIISVSAPTTTATTTTTSTTTATTTTASSSSSASSIWTTNNDLAILPQNVVAVGTVGGDAKAASAAMAKLYNGQLNDEQRRGVHAIVAAECHDVP